MPPIRLNILGAGRAARVVARWLLDARQFEIGQVANASLASAEDAVAFIGDGQAVDRLQALGANDWLLVGLPDSSLVDALADWVDGLPELAFHLSGSLSASELRGWAAHVASVHPARAFAQPDRALRGMPGTWVTGEGDPEALARLEPVFRAAGAQWQTISSRCKPLYHASTVVASNYLVALTELARTFAHAAGLSESAAQSLIAGLQSGTLANLEHSDAADALTGPIERADVARIQVLQQAMISANPDASVLLRELGLATLALARRGRGPRAEDAEIASILRGSMPTSQ